MVGCVDEPGGEQARDELRGVGDDGDRVVVAVDGEPDGHGAEIEREGLQHRRLLARGRRGA